MIRNIRIGQFAFLLSALLVISSCKKPADGDKKDEEKSPVLIRSAVVEVRKLQPTFEVIGTVIADPEKYASLTAPAAGLVEKLVVSEGAKVKAKTLIIELDSREALNALAKAEATYARLIALPRPEELTQAKGTVAKLKSAYDAVEARLKKTRELRARNPELVPDVQWLDEVQKEQTARAEWESAEAQLQLLQKGPREEVRKEAEVDVKVAKLRVEFCRVVAPFDGEIIDIHTHVGQRADLGTVLATMVDTSTVLVQVRVPADRLPDIVKMVDNHKDDLGEVKSPSFPDFTFPIESGWLSQQTEAMTGDVSLRLRVPNPLGKLRIGMSVKVELRCPEVETLAVPEKALTVNEDGERVVTVVKDDKAVPTVVELADEGKPDIRAVIEGQVYVQITKGLSKGDRVAVENGYQLPKDTPVKEMPEEKKAGEEPD
jgi:RND family efflux transporter MFP subunit